ncbi:MAG: hypothetical protein ABSB67_17385 [Bryobacteraceae bacterium]
MEQELQEAAGEGQPAESAAEPVIEPVTENPIAPNSLRVGLAIEFLVALIAVTVTWEEIGGQGHLDLMPWYVKLILIGGFCWSFVRFSAALARPGKWRNRRSVGWLAALIVLAAAMGLITYYYHLHEPADDDDSDETPTTSIDVPNQPPTGAHL